MRGISFEKACRLKQYCQAVVQDVDGCIDNCIFGIEDIVIAPSDTISQWHFFSRYMECRSNEKALQFYQCNEYSLMVVIRELCEDGEFHYSYTVLDSIIKPKTRKHESEHRLEKAQGKIENSRDNRAGNSSSGIADRNYA
ncbi:MAG: hypothetical protein EOP56_17355 [Sphingobacteriales bacterium]|nr:MAG: hypothetical protein EOP56_17355 [Sphingobacteriales bacterium]